MLLHILVTVQSYVTSKLVNLSSPRGPNTNSDQLLCYCYCLLRLMWELHRADKNTRLSLSCYLSLILASEINNMLLSS